MRKYVNAVLICAFLKMLIVLWCLVLSQKVLKTILSYYWYLDFNLSVWDVEYLNHYVFGPNCSLVMNVYAAWGACSHAITILPPLVFAEFRSNLGRRRWLSVFIVDARVVQVETDWTTILVLVLVEGFLVLISY